MTKLKAYVLSSVCFPFSSGTPCFRVFVLGGLGKDRKSKGKSGRGEWGVRRPTLDNWAARAIHLPGRFHFSSVFLPFTPGGQIENLLDAIS